MNILISSCLLGVPCRYDGRAKPHPAAQALADAGHRLIAVCPEVLGGLPTPRPPAERTAHGVFTRGGDDVTQAYLDGAARALAIAQEHGCSVAVLKERSPSCGCCEIYDGSFTGTLIAGQGITAQLLTEHGITVSGESMHSKWNDWR